MKKLKTIIPFLILFLTILVLFAAPPSKVASIKCFWNPARTYTDGSLTTNIVNYRLYYTTDLNNEFYIDVGTNLTKNLTINRGVLYYFGVTAIENGIESGSSEIITYKAPRK